MNVRSFCGALLLALATAGALAQTASRDWQVPPARVPTNAPKLAPLWPADHPVTTKRDWQRVRARLLAEWQQCLGPFPTGSIPLQTEVLATEDLPGFTREHVRYQVTAGEFTDGYLLRPKSGKGKRPGIVVFHPTTPLQAKGVAGVDLSYPEEKRQGLQLVQRGYVVWCPRNVIFDELPGHKYSTNSADQRRLWLANAARVQARHPGWSTMTRMTWDAIRAADFMVSLPDVDARRLGCLGHSLGGKVALYAAAFEPRYRAAVSCEGGIGLGMSNWETPWYFGDAIQRAPRPLDHHEVLALAAPRAFLLLAGDSADDDRSWGYLEAARPVYRLLGRPDHLGWYNHHLGHRYAPPGREAAEAFLALHLKH